MRHDTRILGFCAAAVGVVLSGATSVSAATTAPVVAGSPVTNTAGHDTGTSVFCPGGLSTIGGGTVSGAGGGPSTDLNTTFPFAGGWGADENNGGTANPTLTGYVLCAS